MHLFSHKVSSFSLAEMLVVLVLSGIVLGSIYFAYYTVSTYQINLGKRIKTQNDLGLLFYTLKKDIDRSDSVQTIDTQTLCCYDHERGKIEYTFSGPFSTRRQFERIDTFVCRIQSPIFKFLGKIVQEKAMIDEVYLTEDASESPFEIKLYKMYDAASLIEIAPNDSLRERN